MLTLPRQVYLAVPTMPRLRRSTLLLDMMAGTFLFVLRDNSSHAALHAQVSEEDIRRAKEFLGVPESEPVRWYKVKHRGT